MNETKMKHGKERGKGGGKKKKKSTEMPCFKINESNVPVGTF